MVNCLWARRQIFPAPIQPYCEQMLPRYEWLAFQIANACDHHSKSLNVFRSFCFLQKDENHIIRTDQYNSQWLNLPQFVGSFEAGEYVYFIFREPAVEHISCGKVSVHTIIDEPKRND